MTSLAFPRLVGVVAAVALATVAGCTITTSTPTTSPVPEGMTNACVGGKLRFAAGFKPTTPVSFVGFRTESTTPRPVPGSPTSQEAAWTAVITDDSVGNPCAGSSDVAACLKRFDSLRVLGDQCAGLPIVPKSFGVGLAEAAADVAAPGSGAAAPMQPGNCSVEGLLYTRADDIAAIRTLAEARAFFGVIDSPQEALYLVRLSGEGLSCAEGAPAAYRALPEGGYEIQSTAFGRCGGLVSRKILKVTPAGDISVVSQSTFVDCR
jgi:hypothetical protein